jgi:hypothetical protein
VLSSKIGAAHPLVAPDRVWRAGCDRTAVIEYRNPICERKDDIHVVLDQQYRTALAKACQQRNEVLRLR